LLFASKRARKDIQTVVAFLTTIVKSPDKDDLGKVKRVLRNIRSTIYMPLILRADRLNIVKWWVDASFATHKDCWGHTGATMYLGRGSVIGISKKQKINTRSSTEAELEGVDDVTPQILWTRYFMEEQGLKAKESILNQDNLSAMLLQKNGKESSSKWTKDIWVRYFFIKDRITSGDITLKHCPETEMLGDHFTKPLQGGMLRRFRAEIQRIPANTPDSDLGWDRDEVMARSPSDGSTNSSPQ
jgi:hypothetical protein